MENYWALAEKYKKARVVWRWELKREMMKLKFHGFLHYLKCFIMENLTSHLHHQDRRRRHLQRTKTPLILVKLIITCL